MILDFGLLRFRVRLVVNLNQFLHRDVCINLRGREARVAEEFLYVAQVGAAVQEVRGERVAQGVRADVVYPGSLLYVLVNHAPDRARGDARALVVQEEGVRFPLGGRSVLKKVVAHRQITQDGVERRIAERDYALLAPLARYAQELPSEIYVADVQPRQL